jgi:uncharacterized protein
MKWEQGRRSSNVDDRRGRRRSAGIAIGGGGGVILVAAIMLLMGKDPLAVLQNVLGNSADSGQYVEEPSSPEEDRLADMCSVVLADTEDTWSAIFRKMGKTYAEPTLVIFSGSTESGCGTAGSSTGPFYCPTDQKVYIDLSFYQELQDRFEAPGDFAQAYVIAHEVGHHVQYLLGTLQAVDAKMAKLSKAEANKLSVSLELQADFYAGIWAHYANESRSLLERGDLEEALNAASAIGDDNIQKQSQGYAVPETFTHGTSAQRLKYFNLGYKTGDIKAFDPF